MQLVRLLKVLCLAPEMHGGLKVTSVRELEGRGEESAAQCCYKYAAAVTAHRGSS